MTTHYGQSVLILKKLPEDFGVPYKEMNLSNKSLMKFWITSFFKENKRGFCG